jgi:outer membrane protein
VASRRTRSRNLHEADRPARPTGAVLALLAALTLTGAARAATGVGAARVAAAARVSPAPEASTLRLTLAEAVRIAAAESPSARAAALRSVQAERKVGQSLGALLPSLTGSAAFSNRTFNLKAQGIPFPSIPGVSPVPDVIGPIDNADARVRVSQTVLDLSSWQKWRASGYGARAGRADQEAAGEAAAQVGALAWLRAARTEALVGARLQELALARELLRLAREQQAAGVSPAIDTTRASTQVAVSRGALLVAENQRDRARLDLARSLGVQPASAPGPADSLGDASAATDVPTEPAAALALALSHRPDLVGERARVEKARAEKRATSLERLPRLDAAADWGLSGQHTSDWQDTRSYALGVTLPLLDGGRREARVGEQQALIGEAALRERDLRDQVAADVQAALLDLSSGLDQRRVAAEQLRLAEEEVAQASERFTNGVAGNIEVINAQASLLRAHDTEIDARFALAAARVALARAAGVARQLH